MRKSYLVAVALFFSMPAFAQSLGERSGVNAVIGTAPSAQDFITEAALSDMFEIASSKLALERADEKSKAFAAKMIEDHTATSDELKLLVSTNTVKATLPATLGNEHGTKMNWLIGANKDEFDQRYDELQIEAHKNAVSLFERYAKGGDNTDLKAFAEKHLPHLREHLKMAEDLKK